MAAQVNISTMVCPCLHCLHWKNELAVKPDYPKFGICDTVQYSELNRSTGKDREEKMSRHKRQAVIIIHGVGEQRPLETLKDFVRNVVGREIRNKPDRMSTLFELRRLQLPSRRHQPLTDFYEYYWAHHMRDSKFRMLLSWFRTLLWRKPKTVVRQLRPFYYLSWGILLLSGILCAFGKFIFGLGILALFKILYIIDYNFTRVGYGIVDDAARYLNPTPDNIEQRNRIRKEGIALLDTLHRSGKYNRIIIVGHSLGSVIGYDLIRLYWSSLVPPVNTTCPAQEYLMDWKKSTEAIFNQEGSIRKKVEEFQQHQWQTWLSLRQSDWPWLITDFITAGSPLAHAETLLARNPEEFAGKKYDGEFPASPPMDSHEIHYTRHYTTKSGEKRSLETATHLVPFICTRWTNIYFPHRKLIRGDLIGGSLRPVFCSGIRDVQVGLKGIHDSLLSHTRYWKFSKGKQKKEGCKHPGEELSKALRLDCEQGNSRLP
jgi:hypothetical protein